MQTANVEERLNSLERKHRRLQLVTGALLLGLMVVVVLMGASRHSKRTVPDVIKAHAFEVVDAEGRERGSFGLGILGNPSLYLLDAKGKLQAELSNDLFGAPVLRLSDAKGNARAGLDVGSDGAPGLVLLDAKRKVRAMLVVIADGAPGLVLLDAEGKAL